MKPEAEIAGVKAPSMDTGIHQKLEEQGKMFPKHSGNGVAMIRLHFGLLASKTTRDPSPVVIKHLFGVTCYGGPRKPVQPTSKELMLGGH